MPSANLEKEIAEWLCRLLSDQPPAKNIVAFNVGLFEIEGGYCAYLSGATEYDAASDDWACEEAYKPAEREFPLGKDLFPFPKWDEALVQFQGALKAALGRPELRNSPLSSAVAVTVGFDDGDLERVA
jgi:hypothetical protein